MFEGRVLPQTSYTWWGASGTHVECYCVFILSFLRSENFRIEKSLLGQRVQKFGDQFIFLNIFYMKYKLCLVVHANENSFWKNGLEDANEIVSLWKKIFLLSKYLKSNMYSILAQISLFRWDFPSCLLCSRQNSRHLLWVFVLNVSLMAYTTLPIKCVLLGLCSSSLVSGCLCVPDVTNSTFDSSAQTKPLVLNRDFMV